MLTEKKILIGRRVTLSLNLILPAGVFGLLFFYQLMDYQDDTFSLIMVGIASTHILFNLLKAISGVIFTYAFYMVSFIGSWRNNDKVGTTSNQNRDQYQLRVNGDEDD